MVNKVRGGKFRSDVPFLFDRKGKGRLEEWLAVTCVMHTRVDHLMVHMAVTFCKTVKDIFSVLLLSYKV